MRSTVKDVTWGKKTKADYGIEDWSILSRSVKEAVRDMPKFSKPTNITCKQCQLRKQTRASFKSKERSASKLLEQIFVVQPKQDTCKEKSILCC